MRTNRESPSRFIFLTAFIGIKAMSCGTAQDLDSGDPYAAVGFDSTGNSATKGTKASLGTVVDITQVIAATSGISRWSTSDLPFTGTAVALGQAVTDGQTPFQFNFTYPSANFQFSEAHLVIDTSRDTSDTEGLFVDGIFTGRPPTSMVNLTSPKITDKIYYGNGSSTVNTYYIDWSLAHYKRLTRNTFDLNVSDLVAGTTKKAKDVLSDGVVNVVAGDDSPVYQAYLVIKLACCAAAPRNSLAA